MDENNSDKKPRKKRKLPDAAKPYQFKKGQSGNPRGAQLHKVHPIRRALKELTQQTFKEVIELVCIGNPAALNEMIDNPDTSSLQRGAAIAFRNAMEAGDWGTIERMSERLVGKVPDEIHVQSKNLNANLNANVDNDKVKVALAALDAEI